MTREEQAIEHIKKYRELDEKLYNTAPKGTVSSIATKKCLEYWDMAIQALSQEPTAEKSVQDMTELEKALLHIKTRADAWAVKVVKDALESCTDAVSRKAVLKTLDDMDNVLDEDRTVENYKELLKECYEVLPPVNPQPCDDAISRDAVLDLCDSKDPDYKVIHFKEDVECLPPVTQKYTVFHCPKCGYQDAREL